MIEKISQKEINDRKVENMAMRPNGGSAYQQGGLSAADVRRRFDALALLAIAKYNELVEAILDGSITEDLPTGLEGISFADMLGGVANGAFASYMRAYNDAGVISDVQSIIDGIYRSLNDFGLEPPSGAGRNFGINCTVTCLGYYYKSIDLVNKKIYLTREQVERPVISTIDYSDESFEAPAYNIGEKLAVINHNKYYPDATITEIEHNVITYTGDIGFTVINPADTSTPDMDLDEYAIFVVNQPEVGIVNLKLGAFAAGISNTVLGNGAGAIGTGLLTYGDHGFTINYKNKAAWAAFCRGYGNEGNGFYSDTGGRDNVNDAECGRMGGRWNKSEKTAYGADVGGQNNTARAQNVRMGGKGNTAEVGAVNSEITGEGNTLDARCAHESGKNNNVRKKVNDCTGSDISGESNTLEGALNSKIGGKSNKIKGSEYAGQWGGSQSDVGGLENILDGTNTGAVNVHMHGEKNLAYHRNVDIGGCGNRSSAANQFIRGAWCADNYRARMIIGGGTSDSDRKNALELIFDGEDYYLIADLLCKKLGIDLNGKSIMNGTLNGKLKMTNIPVAGQGDEIRLTEAGWYYFAVAGGDVLGLVYWDGGSEVKTGKQCWDTIDYVDHQHTYYTLSILSDGYVGVTKTHFATGEFYSIAASEIKYCRM